METIVNNDLLPDRFAYRFDPRGGAAGNLKHSLCRPLAVRKAAISRHQPSPVVISRHQ
ncbi:hypothetical protein ACWY4P_54095 (plasmid) [Streptomyces sp. LZ34]